MISDILSMMNPSQSKQNANNITLDNTGTLAKLSNEIKLIENLSLIKFQGSETLHFQGKAVQLLNATGIQHPFSLINTGLPIDVSDLKSAQLNKTNTFQVSLALTKEALPNQTQQITNPPQTKQIENLILASRVVNLTVLSTTNPTNVLPANSSATNHLQPPTNSLLAGSQTNQTTINSAQINTIQTNSSLANTASADTAQINRLQVTSTSKANNQQTLSAQVNASSKNASAISPQNHTSQNITPPSNTIPVHNTQTGNASMNTPIYTPLAENTPQTNATASSVPSQNTPQSSIPINSNQTHLVTVSDGKTEFPIISQTELKRGDVIRVLVDANNNMQVLPAKADSTNASPQIEALKQSLPKQLQLNDMSQLIRQLQTLSEAPSSNVSTQTQQALKQLIQSLPSLPSLTTSPDTMKQAIQTSGVFSESLLMSNKVELLPADLKLNLNRLKDIQENIGALRLGNVPTEQIANAIERITTSQLRHFSDPNQIGTQIYPLHIELPVRNGQAYHFVHIEINKDSDNQQSEKQDRRWLVKLKFDFEETGRFEARTSIQGNKISIIFIAEEKDTLQKLQKNMPILKKQLNDKNIEVEKLDTFQSKLEDKNNTLVKNQSLIDVRT